MHRRRRSRTLALAAVGGMLMAACGSGDDATEASDGLVVWYYFSGGPAEALEKQHELWAEAHPDVPVEYVQIPFEQLPSRLLATASTEDGPDVVLHNVPVDFPALAGAGVLADLTDYWNESEVAEQLPDNAAWRSDDKVYTVMSYTNLLGLYYNQNILDEYDLAPPESVTEFEAAMQTVAADGKYVPLAMAGAAGTAGAWNFMPLLLGRGVDYCNLEGEIVHEEFERLQRWTEQGFVPRDTSTWIGPDAWQQFFGGDVAFGINGNWNLGDARGAEWIGTARFPAGPDGSHVFLGGEGLGIGAFSDQQDLAWEYIETAWLSDEASLINFNTSGQIPTRTDLAEHQDLREDALVRPFVAAAGDSGAWPMNEQTAAMQQAMGAAVSAVISGQKSAEQAADDVIAEVADAREQGGSTC
ncbi:sugar ABC transporter substrate-binding protein [Jiangella asiatica]|nr:ABC transporter substrate-binding protein [Jiangella asiatica]